MAKSSLLLLFKARDLLATESHEGLSIIVDQLFMRQETEEYKSAKVLYDFLVDKYANCLTLKLLKVYRCSLDDVVRLRSIYLLSQTLTALSSRNYELSLASLNDIKALVISCLRMRETKECNIKILRGIVSFVAYNVVMLHNGEWDELSDCILSLAITEPVKAFHVFIDLPPVNRRFIYRFMEKILEKAYEVLHNPEQDRVEDWSLALETVVEMGIQILYKSEMEFKWLKNIFAALVKSVSDLVDKGMEQFLLLGLKNLERFLSRDKKLCDYNQAQCIFVSFFMFNIRELGTHVRTMEAADKITRVVNPER